MKLIVYTQAPEAADYDTATTLERFEHQGHPWRKVLLENSSYRVRYQCERYGSFLRGFPRLDDPRDENPEGPVLVDFNDGGAL